MLDNFLIIAALAGRVCLGLVFALAAIQKIRHWRVLEGVISNYRLLPDALIKPAALLLPPVELLLGGLLLAGVVPAVVAVGGMALLLLFAAAMAVNIRRGRSHIDCGCHQSFLRQTLKPALVFRNVGLTFLLIPVELVGAGRSTALWPIGLGAGLSFFLSYLLINAIAALPSLDQQPFDAGVLS
ncbi:MAG: MauE/DoxX family redox-associated membrane protein [Pseudomonadota bacterium]